MIRRPVRAVARWRGARGALAAFAERERRDRALVITVSVAALALAACGAAMEPQGPPAAKTSSDIVALIDSPRLTSLSLSGDVVIAEGQASRVGGDDLRTYWFTSVGAIAHVQHLGGSLIVRRVLDGTTALDDIDDGGEEPVGTLTDPATFLSEEEINDLVRRWAEEAAVVVEEVNYVPFFGGTAEFVLRPKDELEFMSERDLRMYEFFRDLPQEPRPYLLTIVDRSGAIRGVWGGFLLSDPDQGWQRARLSDGTRVVISESEGFAWQADDLTKALGVDASGRSIEPARPVENVPEPSVADLSSMYEDLCRDLGIERAAKSLESAPTAAAAAKAVAEVEPEGPRRDAIYEGCLRGLSG